MFILGGDSFSRLDLYDPLASELDILEMYDQAHYHSFGRLTIVSNFKRNTFATTTPLNFENFP